MKPARRPRIALQEQEEAFPLPRVPTRVLSAPWPFRESLLPGRGWVRNVTPPHLVGISLTFPGKIPLLED